MKVNCIAESFLVSEAPFIEVLRAYVKKAHSNSYLVAVSDPKISLALNDFHAQPGKNWNVQNLAEVACLSRSAFADRFQSLLGLPPMQYVGRWRMQYSHCKLTETSDAIGDIALKLAGFKHVRNYYGSWNEWSRNAALPVMSVRLVG